MTEEKIKEALDEVMKNATERYLSGSKTVAYKTIDFYCKGGRLMLVQWPGYSDIDLTWSPDAAGYGDIGDPIVSVNTEFFTVEALTSILFNAASKYCE